MSPRRRPRGTAWLIALGALAAAGLVAIALGGRSHPTAHPTRRAPARPTRFAVGYRQLRVVDPARQIRLADGRREPRTLLVEVRYPALGPATATDLVGAPAARASGPFPLVVFGHGFDVTPAPYARLLAAWTRAGFVVAAPIFPRTNPAAPGGPDEADLVNQPADMSLVITRMLAASQSPGNPLDGVIDPARVAVAGQSDGGDAALAVADDPRFRDRRVRAAVILSGAEIPFVAGYTVPRGAPPLLACQGSADTINPPAAALAFFAGAPRPKFLLTLVGAGHLPPYSAAEPQLGIVERVTVAFLERYLVRGSLTTLVAAGSVPGVARLTSDP